MTSNTNSNEDIKKQLDELRAALPTASGAVRAVLDTQIAALQAKLDAAAGNSLTANDIDTGGGDVVVGQKIVIHHAAPEEAASAGFSPLAQRLYAVLNAHWFDLGDLQDLAFNLNVDWDSLSGDAKGGKARALTRYCEKNSLLPRLQSLMRLARPNLKDQLNS